MSQTHQSEQFRILKQYIEQKDFDNFNGFLDNNEISKKTLNSILCFTLQNYRSNYEMSDYIQLLIEKGAEQNSMFRYISSNQGPRIDEKDNVSILMYACIYADIRLIDLIVTKKNINLRDKNGKNALFYVLCDKGDNPDVIYALISHEIDVNCIGKVDIGDKNYENHTALSLSATKNMTNSFKILIKGGADPNYKVIQTGDTVLHIAIRKKNIEMVELLLETNQIKFDEKNKENKTPLELALEMKDENIYNLIKEKIEEGNRQGDIVAKELLTENKKNINMSNKKQNDIKNNSNLILVNGDNTYQNKEKKNESDKKIINIKKEFENKNGNKIKILDRYIKSKVNSVANLEIQFTYLNNLNNNLDINNNNNDYPILTIDLLSKEFNEFKESYSYKKEEEKEIKRILEEENKYMKKEIARVYEKYNYETKKKDEIKFEMRENEEKYKLNINELNKKISFLEKEHENDKKLIGELKNKLKEKEDIIKSMEKDNKYINTNQKKDTLNKNSNSNSQINYLNKKFIDVDYKLKFSSKEKIKYILNFLSKDISEFEKYVELNINSSNNINEELLKNIEIAVNESIPDYQANLYGSYATNLCLPWSDLDIVLVPKNKKVNIKESNHILLTKLYEHLKNQKWIKSINYISSANIPIIKICSVEKYNNKLIDISIQEEKHFGLKCVDLVKQFIVQYECLKPLVLSLKNILKRAHLNDPYKGGISSYGLILMIIYFLKKQNSSGIDISLGDNNNNLGQLFYDFLNFYAFNFDFENNIIYIKNTSDDLVDLNYQNIGLNSRFIIIDPLNPNNNVAKSCFHVFEIKLAFLVSLKSLFEDCECGCHYSENYDDINKEQCFLQRIFHAVKRFNID